MGRDYVVEANLIDRATNEIVAHHEGRFVLPADLEPDVYDLQIALFDAETGERLPVSDLEGESLGDSFSLGEITITS